MCPFEINSVCHTISVMRNPSRVAPIINVAHAIGRVPHINLLHIANAIYPDTNPITNGNHCGIISRHLLDVYLCYNFYVCDYIRYIHRLMDLINLPKYIPTPQVVRYQMFLGFVLLNKKIDR